MLNTLLKLIYTHVAKFVELKRAQARMKRSLRDLEKLDDRLLEDVGLLRNAEGNIVSARLDLHSDVAVSKKGNLADIDRVINKRFYFARRRL